MLDLAVDVGAVEAHEIVARIDERCVRPLSRRVCHEVLDVGAHAFLRRFEVRALRLVACRAETAVVVLSGQDVAAVGKESRLFQCLAKGDVGTHAFRPCLLVVESHDLLDGAGELRLRVAPPDESRHLLGCRLRRAHDLDALGRRLLLQDQLGQRLGNKEAHLCRRFLVDLGGKICRKVRAGDEHGRGSVLLRAHVRHRRCTLHGEDGRPLRRLHHGRQGRSRTCGEKRRQGNSRQKTPHLLRHSSFGHKTPPSSFAS